MIRSPLGGIRTDDLSIEGDLDARTNPSAEFSVSANQFAS